MDDTLVPRERRSSNRTARSCFWMINPLVHYSSAWYVVLRGLVTVVKLL